jgi:hypothetical protein
MQPTIISSYDAGRHAADLAQTVSRLDQEAQWRDLSLLVIVPAGGSVPTRVVSAWWNLMMPPNNRSVKLFAVGMEVGVAYSACIESILANPVLAGWRYILTLEHDNIPPADGVVQLLKTAEANPEFAAIGGLYFTKGPGGVAQIWGDPSEHALNFRPQPPLLNGGLKECCGVGMGFTLFRLEMFKDPRLRRPWFKTAASATEGAYSQDLYFWADARKWGHRCAVDCGVRVGHYDSEGDVIW